MASMSMSIDTLPRPDLGRYVTSSTCLVSKDADYYRILCRIMGGKYVWFDLGNEKTEYKLNPRKEMEATVKSVEGICRLPQDRGMWADVMSRGSIHIPKFYCHPAQRSRPASRSR